MATVRKSEYGFSFCNGYSDPFACRCEADAMKYFREFLSDKVCAFQPKKWMGDNAYSICKSDMMRLDGFS